jgi:hypothetical protein
MIIIYVPPISVSLNKVDVFTTQSFVRMKVLVLLMVVIQQKDVQRAHLAVTIMTHVLMTLVALILGATTRR